MRGVFVSDETEGKKKGGGVVGPASVVEIMVNTTKLKAVSHGEEVPSDNLLKLWHTLSTVCWVLANFCQGVEALRGL